MKNVILTLVVSVLLGTASMAIAADCSWPYVGLIGGASISEGSNLNLATGYSVGGVAGFEFCNARVEAEIVHRSNKIDIVNNVAASSGDISMNSYMVNGYYEFNTNSKKWRPYVGGGAGLADSEITAITVGGVQVSSESSDIRFAYQGIGGVGFYLTKNLVLDVSYRYFSTLQNRFDNLTTKFTTHNMAVGARWRF